MKKRKYTKKLISCIVDNVSILKLQEMHKFESAAIHKISRALHTQIVDSWTSHTSSPKGWWRDIGCVGGGVKGGRGRVRPDCPHLKKKKKRKKKKKKEKKRKEDEMVIIIIREVWDDRGLRNTKTEKSKIMVTDALELNCYVWLGLNYTT